MEIPDIAAKTLLGKLRTTFHPRSSKDTCGNSSLELGPMLGKLHDKE